MAIDATVAGASSNSYCTEADADAYFAIRSGSAATAWAAAASQDKENALLVAAQMMDCVRYFYRKWSEAFSDTAQALQFPREHHVNESGTPYIDQCVKNAQIEQAGSLISAQTANITGMDADTLSELRGLGIDSVRVGTTSLSFGGIQSVKDPRKAELLELGFSVSAASLLMRYVSKTGSVIHDAENLIRISELRRLDVFKVYRTTNELIELDV